MSPHISVAGVARKGDAVLVMRRVPGGHVGGLWEFPGGKTEDGETPQAALRREWLEETSLNIDVGEEIARGGFRNGEKVFTLVAYEVHIPDMDAVPDLIEHDDWMWVDISQLHALAFVDSDQIAVEALQRGNE